MSHLLLILAIFTSSIQLHAAEVDQYTRRDELILDSSDLLNEKANKSILSAIERTNSKSDRCDEIELYEELREYFSNHFKGELVIDILKDPKIAKRVINLDDSVYQDWTVWDGIGMGLNLFSKKGLTMSGVMRIGEQTIGTDKLEHMFGQGFLYFKKNYIKNRGEIKALKRGVFGEKFILGGNKIGNGVFSYGDLAANFNGMRFWNHILQMRDDVLGAEYNLGPYITCQDNKWVQVKEIDFTQYIDDSMDETINCSKFPSKKTAEKFIKKLEERGMFCPMDPQRLDLMKVKYGKISKWILNSDGIEKVKYFGEFRH